MSKTYILRSSSGINAETQEGTIQGSSKQNFFDSLAFQCITLWISLTVTITMLFDLNNNSVITQLKYPGDTRHHFLIFIGKSLTFREEYSLLTKNPKLDNLTTLNVLKNK